MKANNHLKQLQNIKILCWLTFTALIALILLIINLLLAKTNHVDIKQLYSIEQYKSDLQQSLKIKQEERLHTITPNQSFDYGLYVEIATVESHLNILELRYQDKIEELQAINEGLRQVGAGADIDDKILEQALDSLNRGDSSYANQLLSETSEQADKPLELIAFTEFVQGLIDQSDVNLRQAYHHYAKAIALQPNREDYVAIGAFIARHLAKHQQALDWGQQSKLLAKQAQDPQGIAASHNRTAKSHYERGQYQQAVDNYQIALAANIETHGKDHPLVAEDHNNLASAYHGLRQYPQALKYFLLSLKSNIVTYGEDHQLIAEQRNHLGHTYMAMGQYQQAIFYHTLALNTNIRIFGKDHVEVATNHNSLGLAFSKLGHIEKASEYFQLALNSDLKTYGESHPEVANRQNNLGLMYFQQEQYQQALELLEKALATNIEFLPQNHPSIARTQESIDVIKATLKQNQI